MTREFMFRISICVVFFGLCMYLHVEKQNTLTKLRIKTPELVKQIKTIREEISQLQYEIEQFENPAHLMELAHLPEYSHLKHPFLKDIITSPQGLAFQESQSRSPLAF